MIKKIKITIVNYKLFITFVKKVIYVNGKGAMGPMSIV